MTFTTRFAPSPTGPLHLGHAYSALLAHDMARAQNGCFLLRIEDIDHTRSKEQWETQIYDDLSWLGITWDGLVMRQSDRIGAYAEALDTLWEQDLLYPCTCNRRDITAAISAPQEGSAPHIGPDGLTYPGTCRNKPYHFSPHPRSQGVLRLKMSDGIKQILSAKGDLGFNETSAGPDGQAGHIPITSKSAINTIGDIVLSRREFEGSYHLSVILDDAAQSITHVIRGADLFEATKIHVILQNLLDLPSPTYHHHRLIRDDQGKRLAKRDDARSIATYRAEGASPQDIRNMIGL